MRLCLICKKEIEPERIESVIGTRLCTEHGHEIEQFGGEFKLTASQERTSKKTSLKVNYGSVSTARIRNDDAIEDLKDLYEEKRMEAEG